MSQPNPTREDLIYLWKLEGGNLSWARWCKIHGIPEHNPAFLEEVTKAGKGIKDWQTRPK